MEGRILFIDGYCVLCNGLAKYILEKNKDKSISVASLQGKTAAKFLSKDQLRDLDTVFYLKEGVIHDKSSAALRALVDVGGWRKVLFVFFILPKFIRDRIYNIIATNRYEWFGQKRTCALPGKSDSVRMLD